MPYFAFVDTNAMLVKKNRQVIDAYKKAPFGVPATEQIKRYNCRNMVMPFFFENPT